MYYEPRKPLKKKIFQGPSQPFSLSLMLKNFSLSPSSHQWRPHSRLLTAPATLRLSIAKHRDTDTPPFQNFDFLSST